MEEYKGFQEEEKKKGASDAEITESHDDSGMEDDEMPGEKQRKNWMAAIIILAGLLVGSVLVDVVQLVTGQGVSQHALKSADVFELDGKTWVAYEEPVVKVRVLSDETCDQCTPDDALLFLRRYMPTILADKIDVSSDAGKKLVDSLGIKTLPAFVFDDSVKDTMFYAQASPLFEGKDEAGSDLVLNTRQIGIPVGKYLELPKVDENSARIGSADAPVQIIEYSDFQCPYCGLMYPVIEQALDEFDGQVSVVFKQFPLTSIHPQAMNAALASECALEQGKFKPYYDMLFTRQDAWSKTEGTASFKQYARELGLNGQEFNTCLDSQKYADKVNADLAEGQEFGISGTPGFFIGDEFLGGAAQYDTIKSMIEKQLGIDDSDAAEDADGVSEENMPGDDAAQDDTMQQDDSQNQDQGTQPSDESGQDGSDNNQA